MGLRIITVAQLSFSYFIIKLVYQKFSIELFLLVFRSCYWVDRHFSSYNQFILIEAKPYNLVFMCNVYVNSQSIFLRDTQMIGRIDTIKQNQQKIFTFYSDSNISNLLLEQLKEIYESEYGNKYTLSLTSESLHLYLYFQKMRRQDEEKDEQEHSSYVIRIGKGFPLEGMRVHILNNIYQPRLFDCRNILEEILGSRWSYKNKLIDIFHNMEKFQAKLSLRNKSPLAMQQTGQFILNDIFDSHELSKYSSMDTFEDKSSKDGPLLATTETHFLTFKNINSKYNPYKTTSSKLYILTRICELQCINEIYYNHKNSQVIITMCKYKTIKSFNEYQKISKKYKLDDPELFLRNILKNITQFQKININLEINPLGWKGEADYEKINQKIKQSKDIQQNYGKNEYKMQENERKKILSKLVKNYQKIIGYFSERANAYYLIFVNKLNALYSKQITNSFTDGSESKKSDKSFQSNDS